MEHVAALLEAMMHRDEDPVEGIAGSLEELLGPRGDRLAACMRERGTAITPTLSTYVPLIESLEDPVQKEMTSWLLGAGGLAI